MPKTQQFALMAALLAFIALGMPGAAGAAGFDQFVGLGDSTLDTGYFRYTPTGTPAIDDALPGAIAQGAKGGFAGNGVMGATMLAGRFGLDAGPSSDGGTNYANGGCYTMTNQEPSSGNVSTIRQIQTYLQSVNNVANSHALYVISSGNNDLIHPPSSDPNFLSESASQNATSVASLQAAGARTILVPNSFLYAVYAASGGGMDSDNATAYATSVSYNLLRWSNLTAAGVHFVPADLDSVFRYVVQNPARFGFTTDSVLATSAPVYNDPSPYNTAILAVLTPAQQQEYLFIDGHHLTTAGQTIEADYEYSLLAAPSQISLLAESAVQNGWAHAATIQGQIDPCGRYCRPSGGNLWASAGTYSLNVKNERGLPSDSGTPFGGTVGIDYQTAGGLIVGAAFTSGSQVPGFSTGGHFSQVDEAPSLYVGYVGGSLWGNAVATYDLLQYDTKRSVPLGIFTDQNHANTSGQSLAVALRGGCELGVGRFATGPVAGLVVQQVEIDGFTETGDSGVTALSFDGQTRESLVTQLGWRLLADQGDFRPFAEMNWNHECAGRDRTVTASLTSVGAPSYTMDAVPAVSDWATTSLGAFYALSPRVMLRGSASAMFINPQMTTCGGELGLNYSF